MTLSKVTCGAGPPVRILSVSVQGESRKEELTSVSSKVVIGRRAGYGILSAIEVLSLPHGEHVVHHCVVAVKESIAGCRRNVCLQATNKGMSKSMKTDTSSVDPLCESIDV